MNEAPAGLAHLRGKPGGEEWLAAMPGLVDAAVERWHLRLGQAYDDVYESVVFPADLPDGTPAVLKVRWPNRENRHEGTALRTWAGDGAVRLHNEADDLGALLLERSIPGTPLSDVPADEALDVFVDLLPRLWKPAGPPFTTLAEEAVTLAGNLTADWERQGRPFERRLVDMALDAFATLAGTQGPSVLLHQDLHGDNVLRSERLPWLAIDPKPLAGEREFGVVPIVRSSELGHSRSDVLRRLDRLTSHLGLDRERARRWTIAHTVAWSFEGDGVIATHLETARWLLDAGT